MEKKQKKTLVYGTSITMIIILFTLTASGIYYSLGIKSNGGVREVTFYSNMDFYLDGGFNEETFQGVDNYGETNEVRIGIQTASAFHDYGEGSKYTNDLIRIFRDADYVVSSGGNVAEVILTDVPPPEQLENQQNFYDEVTKNTDKSFILLDDAGNVTADYGNENYVSVSYASEDAGFLAGIAASVYSTSISESKEGSNDNYVGMWGGVEGPTATFLSGFEQAVNWFNYIYFGFTPGDETKEDIVKITPFSESDSINYNEAVPEFVEPGEDKSWYTGGFDYEIGKDSADAALRKAEKMNDENVNVLFPVAGGQTSVALGALDTNKEAKIIGVDTDAGMAFPEYVDSERILGSATKELGPSAEYSIWYEKDFKQAYDEYMISDEYKIINNKDDFEDIDNLSYDSVVIIMDFAEMQNYIETEDDEGNIESGAANFASVYDVSLASSDKQGWNTTNANGIDDETGKFAENGSSFYGDVANGGVGFIETGPYLNEAVGNLERSITINGETIIDDSTSFNDLMMFAYIANPYISSQSKTFLSDQTSSDEDNDDIPDDWKIDYK